MTTPEPDVTSKKTPPFNQEHPLKKDFREAMARLGAAVNLVTTDGPAGRAGFAATAVCSVSDSPPMMIVCLNRASSAYEAVKTNGVVCINILAETHQELSKLFGGKTPIEERFSAGQWYSIVSGAPALHGAIASLDCEITNIYDGSSHDILVCEVIDIRNGILQPALVYLNRAYHSL